MDWIGVIKYWNEDLFYSDIQQKLKNMEFLKAMLAKMNARMDATQEKMDTNTKEMQAKMKDMMESHIGFLVSRMEVNR
jgi:hypothetical protein